MTNKKHNTALVFADGTVFTGYGIGVKGITDGEICFNTALTGYQETLTDPSFYKQIITFTFPHIGNVGTNKDDVESSKIFATGLVTGVDITEPSSYRSTEHFNTWLQKNNITGITGVDTRAITRYIRLNGAQNVVIQHAESLEQINFTDLQNKAKAVSNMDGMELAALVTSSKKYSWDEAEFDFTTNKYKKSPNGRFNVVAVDFGIKRNILRNLSAVGCNVTVVPAKTNADEILGLNPDGVFLSNGPGDPAETSKYAESTIKKLVDSDVPVFGICLGHQLLATALGAKTKKMHQGHRGANHPVKNLETNKVEITSQNHGFCVTRESMGKDAKNELVETHISLFDGTNEGIRHRTKDAFSVQHHPEASPGPKDAFYLFEQFIAVMEKRKRKAA
jgi:carbamoyl-phosphate synthase small subunit